MQSYYLSELFAQPIVGTDVVISGLAIDSRQVKAGDLFFAYQGAQQDGHQFIAQAIKNGAVAVALEKTAYMIDKSVSYVVVQGLAGCLGDIAARFYQHASAMLKVIGVTGTNGKTSITHYIAQLLNRNQQHCAVIGTLGAYFAQHKQATTNTTPDAVSLQALFADCKAQAVDYIAMEVSSHALVQGRCQATHFTGAVFSNLTQDHLDFHGTMENYYAAKKQLFTWQQLNWAVINIDDAYGQRLCQEVHGTMRVLSYALTNRAATVYLQHYAYQHGCYQGQLVIDGDCFDFRCDLQGEFNVKNVLAAVSSVYALGVDKTDIVKQIPHLTAVAGRMQAIKNNHAVLAIVDYAHTPDALENVLRNLKTVTQGKLSVVFGCGGDRDKTKRPLMAAVAEKYADVVVVTTDNPRTEDIPAILADIQRGFSDKNYHVIADRAAAIEFAVQIAKPLDTVLVAGKGHETYQIIGTEKHDFDDAVVLAHALMQKEALC